MIALGLRLIGIGWGLKNDLHYQTYHPDELVNFDVAERIIPGRGQVTPGYYNYGTLFFTVQSIASEVVTVYGGAPEKDPDSKWSWLSRCLFWGRVLVAMCGAGTAVLLFAMMRRFTSLVGAVLCGAVIAVAPSHVVHSRFFTVDVMATFLLVASAYAALKLLPATAFEEREIGPKLGLKYAALAGLFAGLSAGTKYTGILALLTLYAVLFLAKRPRWLIEGAVGTLTAIAAFVISTPGCILDQQKFLEDVQFEMHHVATGHGLAFLDTPSGFIYHLSNLFIGLGTILTLCCVGGLVWAAVRKEKWCWALLAFAIPYYILIGREEVKFLRYTFPLYLALAAGFGWAVVELHRRGGWAKLGVAICICGIGGLDFGGLRSAVTQTAWMASEDPRDSAIRYIRSVATPTTRVGMCREQWFWSIPIVKDNDLPATAQVRLEGMRMAADPPVDIVTNPQGTESVPFSPDLVTKLHPEFIAFTSLEDANLDRLHGSTDISPGDKTLTDHFAAFADVLKKEYVPVHVFGTGGMPVEDMQYINPVVEVWKRNAKP